MRKWRAFLIANSHFAFAILALALAMKALLPAGFMLDGGFGRSPAIMICGSDTAAALVQPIAGKTKADEPAGSDGDHASAACPHGVLSMAALPGDEGMGLAVALAFTLALSFFSAPRTRVKAARRLRPPLRAPPLVA